MCYSGAANAEALCVVVSVRLWVILLIPLSNHTTPDTPRLPVRDPPSPRALCISRLVYLSAPRICFVVVVPSRLFVSARALVSSAAVLAAAPAALLGSGVVFGEGFVQALVRVSQISSSTCVVVIVGICVRLESRRSFSLKDRRTCVSGSFKN